MPNTFLIADTHFGHHGVTKFLNEDGSKLRPWDNIEEMDEALVSNWNGVVGPKDRVYLLGDAVINRRALPTLGRLNGKKVLIKGNHDVFRLEEYIPYFEDVLGCKVLSDMILTHIPVHTNQLYRFEYNVHGHMHSEIVYELDEYESRTFPDNRYLCVSVEQINYAPISLDEVRSILKGRC